MRVKCRVGVKSSARAKATACLLEHSKSQDHSPEPPVCKARSMRAWALADASATQGPKYEVKRPNRLNKYESPSKSGGSLRANLDNNAVRSAPNTRRSNSRQPASGAGKSVALIQEHRVPSLRDQRSTACSPRNPNFSYSG